MQFWFFTTAYDKPSATKFIVELFINIIVVVVVIVMSSSSSSFIQIKVYLSIDKTKKKDVVVGSLSRLAGLVAWLAFSVGSFFLTPPPFPATTLHRRVSAPRPAHTPFNMCADAANALAELISQIYAS